MADETEPLPELCDGCGSRDTDPMIHIHTLWKKDDRVTIDTPSFHFDCVPTEFRSLDLLPVTVATIEAAESGVKGAELRDFIAEQDHPTPEEA